MKSILPHTEILPILSYFVSFAEDIATALDMLSLIAVKISDAQNTIASRCLSFLGEFPEFSGDGVGNTTLKASLAALAAGA